MKNTVVIQSDSSDRTTDDVITWIHYLTNNIEVVNIWDLCEIIDFKLSIDNDSPVAIRVNEVEFNANDAYWYRRGKFVGKAPSKDQYLHNLLLNISTQYINPVVNFLHSKINQFRINKYQDNQIGKLKMLFLAKEHGISVPPTIITNKLTDLKEFLDVHTKIVTKPTENPFLNYTYFAHKYSFSSPTQQLTKSKIESLSPPSLFLPSLFQKYIDKKFEIRSFYLKGEFYSMAIFSQSNEKTKIDFRNYDYAHPNRVVPFKLPSFLEKKLNYLMMELELDSGSFDLIYTPEQEFYFLEVNPVGQFQWLSRNCNYYLEKLIASHLIQTVR